MIDLIVQGHSVAKACRKVKLSNSTLYATMKRYKWIKDAYDIAQEQACDALESALLDIDTDPVYESDDPGKQRVTSNNIKWILARKNRVRFGNQTQHDAAANAQKAEKIVSALQRAKKRSSLLEQSAEGVGFEPSLRAVAGQRFSRPLLSSTQPPLLA